jgi:hypothetical protein
MSLECNGNYFWSGIGFQYIGENCYNELEEYI